MTGETAAAPSVAEPVHDPHPGVECCPCVERLRAQNKASSDEWTQRTATMLSDLEGLRSLMREAREVRHPGLSAYGQAALAAAYQTAEEAEGKAEAFYEQMLRERRTRIATQRDLRIAREAIATAESGRDDASVQGRSGGFA